MGGKLLKKSVCEASELNVVKKCGPHHPAPLILQRTRRSPLPAFVPREQIQEIQKLIKNKNSYPSQASPVLTKLSGEVSSEPARGPQALWSVSGSIPALPHRAWH